MKAKKWQQLSTTRVYANEWISVRVDEVRKPNGKKAQFTVLDTPPGVFVVALTTDNQVYLVHQFRYPTQMDSWEVVGGGSDNQDILEAAKRELKEETGLVAETWQKVGVFQSFNGLGSEIGHVFLARNVRQTNDNEQREEGIEEVKVVPFSEVWQMIKRGEITDSQSIAALVHAAIQQKIL